MPDASLEGARQKAERIRSAVKALALTYRDRPLGTITVSLGVAMFPVDAADQESLIRAADEALYAAKHAGRDRVVVHSAPAARTEKGSGAFSGAH